MIVYNGSTGSLGAYFQSSLGAAAVPGLALRSRLERPDLLRRELASSELADSASLTLVQLAARVSVPECERDPEAAFRINVAATLAYVLEFCAFARSLGLRPTVVYVSSGHVYAEQPPGTWLTEEHPTMPRSVYAHTKLAAETALAASLAACDARLVVARVFGLVAPKQPAHYLLPAMLRRVVEGALESIPGLDCVRDYLDSRDVCRTLLALALAERLDETTFNVCSERPTAVRHVLDTVIGVLRPHDAEELRLRVSAAPARADDVAWLVGSSARLQQALGRSPVCIPLEQTVRDAVRGMESGRP